MLKQNTVRQTIQKEIKTNVANYGKLRQAMNRLYPNFPTQLFNQLFNQCQKNSNQEIFIQQYAKIVVKAQYILKERVQEQTNSLRNVQIQLKNLKQEIEKNPNDKTLQRKQNLLLNEQANINSYIISFEDQIQILSNTFNQRNKDSIPSSLKNVQNQQNQQSKSKYTLLVLLIFSIICFFFFILNSFGKSNFYNLIAILSVLAIFALNYFDSKYIKLCLILISVSIGIDILWLILNFSQWTNPNGQLKTTQTSSYTYVCVMTIILLILRIPIALILFLYKDSKHTDSQNVNLCFSRNLQLGNCQLSPVSKAIQDKGRNFQ